MDTHATPQDAVLRTRFEPSLFRKLLSIDVQIDPESVVYGRAPPLTLRPSTVRTDATG